MVSEYITSSPGQFFFAYETDERNESAKKRALYPYKGDL